MADKKIADLTEATTLSDTDVVIVEDNANTKKITKANLKSTLGVTQVEADIDAVETSIGNRTYTEQNVVTNGESITNSINELDKAYIPYEEGTWTPVIMGSTTVGVGTYASQVGNYEKIGNLVHFNFNLSLTDHTGDGNIRISLPFTHINNIITPVTIMQFGVNYTGFLSGAVVNGTNYMQIYEDANGIPIERDKSFILWVSGTYKV